MATIHMQIKIYTLPYLLTDAKSHSQVLYVMMDSMTTQLSALTHIMQICCNFDVTNSLQYRAGFAPMLFQWSHSHMQCFSVANSRQKSRDKKGSRVKKIA